MMCKDLPLRAADVLSLTGTLAKLRRDLDHYADTGGPCADDPVQQRFAASYLALLDGLSDHDSSPLTALIAAANEYDRRSP
jgi:hypothetical protein